MGKGQYALFDCFEKKKEQSTDRVTKSQFMPARNLVLVHRFFFYGWIKQYKFSAALDELQREFFLSEARLVDVLSETDDILQQLHTTPPTVEVLSNKFPWLNWQV